MENKDYIYGKNAVRAYLSSQNNIKECLMSFSFKDDIIMDLLTKKRIVIKKVDNKYLDKMFDNKVHQGIALKVPPYEYSSLESIIKKCENKSDSLIVLLDGLEDPQNLGAIIRSCDAFKVDAIIIPSSRSVNVTSSVIKVSTGAINYVPIVKVSNLNQTIEVLKKHNFWFVATDGSASLNYDEIDYKMKVGLIIGSEGKGISNLTLKNSDYVVKIPMFGHVNSLNASVATGITLAMISHLRK